MTPTEIARPSPEALLRQARKEGRGRLKVYLGASPGVGKTYEMLSDGAALMRSGTDVVIGVVETHGRAETRALTEGFEIVPRRQIRYQGRTLEEMDLDGLLARRPVLALVDELAHTNAPGSRHPKRYQDVEELLAAGIDVYTTVNIQHIESLNDVVASFTRVRVRETVPDDVLENAEIEVVDIPPDELIERLKAGKVYVPEEASRALGHFFSRSNLSALRELALRQAAQRIDREILSDLDAAGLAGTWAAGERLMVAVSELPGSEGLVRATKRLADALRAPWVALTIETARSASLGDADRQRLAATIQLAARLGAEIVSIPADTVLEGIKRYANGARITQIVVGKSARSRWFELRHGSVVDRLVRETPDVAVHVLPMPTASARAPAGAVRGSAWGPRAGYAWSALAIAATTAIGKAIDAAVSIDNLALIYLIPVLFAATRFGLHTGVVTGLFSALSYNFFFLPPLYTLTVSDPENIVTLIMLVGVAIGASQLAARVQAQARIAERSSAQNSALAGFARNLTGVTDREQLGGAICEGATRLLGTRSLMLVHRNGSLTAIAGSPDVPPLSAIDQAAAEWAMERGEEAGSGTATLTASDWVFHPIVTGDRAMAVLGLAQSTGGGLRSDQRQMLISLLDQAALAMRRVMLEEDLLQVAHLEERGRLQRALLSSVSHDLRTPLTSILAAATQLEKQAPSTEGALIGREARRLDRFVSNLLEMVRVETGVLDLKLNPIDLTDAVASASHDLRAALAEHPLQLQVPPDLPLVLADERLLHQCLLNLIDNAAKFSPPRSPILIRAERRIGAIDLAIVDAGPGLPQGSEDAVFETFRRLDGSDRVGGTGLGLAIVRGFATGMGLQVRAQNRSDTQGAEFIITFGDDRIVKMGEPR